MTSRTELIEALREAKEGSRELDARIYSAIHGRRFERMDDRGTNITDPLSFCFWADGKRHTVWAAAAYTRSLDAALTLVGSREWSIAWYEDTRCACVYADKEAEACEAATPPLALCIAALSSLPEGDLK